MMKRTRSIVYQTSISHPHLNIQEKAPFRVGGENMSHIMTFDSKQRYIFLSVFVISSSGQRYEFDALLDTVAPFTEFSDQALHYAGFLDSTEKEVKLKPNIQTQKYGALTQS